MGFLTMLTVENYLNDIRTNLNKKSDKIIKSFNKLTKVTFSDDTNVLIIDTPVSVEKIYIDLAAFEDMFDPIDVPENTDDYFYDISLATNVFLYGYEEGTDEERDAFDDFSYENNLEQQTIKEIGSWIKQCLEKSDFTSPYPIYYRVLDEENALNLVTGKWEDQQEIVL